MKGFHSLEKGCPAGIPFSKCREYMEKQKKQKTHTKHRKNTKHRNNTNRRKNTNHMKKKHTFKRTQVPPKGVVIRKNNKLYRSNGISLKLI